MSTPGCRTRKFGSGARWSDAIAESLNETDFGIVCVTRANQHAPWLIFEAGALAKSVATASVVPLCVNLAPADVTGPLAAFQGRRLDRDGVRRLVRDINAATEKPMPAERLEDVFEAMWPRFEPAVLEASKDAFTSTEPHRSDADMLAELVDRMRRVERAIAPPHDDRPAVKLTRADHAAAVQEVSKSVRGDREAALEVLRSVVHDYTDRDGDSADPAAS
jgi:hypothetical protein